MSQPAAGNDQQLVDSPQKRKRKSNARHTLALTPEKRSGRGRAIPISSPHRNLSPAEGAYNDKVRVATKRGEHYYSVSEYTEFSTVVYRIVNIVCGDKR